MIRADKDGLMKSNSIFNVQRSVVNANIPYIVPPHALHTIVRAWIGEYSSITSISENVLV